MTDDRYLVGNVGDLSGKLYIDLVAGCSTEQEALDKWLDSPDSEGFRPVWVAWLDEAEGAASMPRLVEEVLPIAAVEWRVTEDPAR